MISFDVSRDDATTIRQIVQRARSMDPDLDVLSLEMDLCATHANGMPMEFERLLGADDFNFAHDVFGIRRHMDRSTGQLLNCFVPRFASKGPR